MKSIIKFSFSALLFLLLTSCGTKTEKIVEKITDKIPVAVTDGEITAISCQEHEVYITVSTSSHFDFKWYNQHPDITKKIRSLILGAQGEKTYLGALLRNAYAEGYDIIFNYQGPKGLKNKQKTNTVEFTPADMQDIFDKYSNQTPQVLHMLANLEYINSRLPEKIDDVTTQEKSEFKDGCLVFKYVISADNIDWARAIKEQDTFRKTIAQNIAEQCKKEEALRSILKQCLSSGFNYVYEYSSKQDPSNTIRLTFTPQDIKAWLF